MRITAFGRINVRRYGALPPTLRRAVLGVERGDAREGVAAEQRVGGAQDAAGQGREGGRVVEEVLVRLRVRLWVRCTGPAQRDVTKSRSGQ